MLSYEASNVTEQMEYWRTRAERYMDAIGVKQGVIASPVMMDTPRVPSTNAIGQIFEALRVTEVDTTKSGRSLHPDP